MATPKGFVPTGSFVDTARQLTADARLFLLQLVNQSAAAGPGNVTGPASSTDNAIARYDGTTGQLIQNSGITIADGATGTLAGSNSGDVTLAGTPTYLTIAGQVITRALINLTSMVTGRLPYANLVAATAASLLVGRRSGSAGDFEEVTLGTGLSMSAGAVLSATGLGGTVTTTGSPANGNLTKFSGASTITNTDLTGDVTTSGGVAATLVLPLTNDGNSSTALTIDFLSKANGRHRLTLTGNVTFTLSNPIDGGVYVILIATGAGSFTATWPAAVLWPSGVAPTITTTASKVDLVTLIYASGAAKYYGSFNQSY